MEGLGLRLVYMFTGNIYNWLKLTYMFTINNNVVGHLLAWPCIVDTYQPFVQFLDLSGY